MSLVTDGCHIGISIPLDFFALSRVRAIFLFRDLRRTPTLPNFKITPQASPGTQSRAWTKVAEDPIQTKSKRLVLGRGQKERAGCVSMADPGRSLVQILLSSYLSPILDHARVFSSSSLRQGEMQNQAATVVNYRP